MRKQILTGLALASILALSGGAMAKVDIAGEKVDVPQQLASASLLVLESLLIDIDGVSGLHRITWDWTSWPPVDLPMRRGVAPDY